VLFGDGPGDLLTRCQRKSGEFTDVDTAADDVALLCPTSGSTGTPKIIMHFHRDVLANADTFARFLLQPTPDDVFAGSPPLAFTFGLGGLVVFPLRFGASALLTERTTPVELAELSHRAGATVLFTAPTGYRAIVKQGKADLLHTLRTGGVSRGASAGRHLAAGVRAGRSPTDRRDRRHRDVARVRIRRRRRHSAGQHRSGRTRISGRRAGRSGQPSRAVEPTKVPVASRQDARVVLVVDSSGFARVAGWFSLVRAS